MDSHSYLKYILTTSELHPERCMRCGKCSASCPSFDEMELPPHLFVYLVEMGDMDALLQTDSLYHCLNCMACVERCPRGIEPGRMVEELRDMARLSGENRQTCGQELMARADEDMPQQALTCVMRKFAE